VRAEAAETTCQQTTAEARDEENRQNRKRGVRRISGPADAAATIRLAIDGIRALFRAEGTPLDEGEALAVMADHFVEVWAPEVVRIREKIGPSRLRVLERTGGLCAVPGCSNPAEHEHHVRFRSRGGGEEDRNRSALCDRHHLAGIHGGWVSVEGVAGECLVWELGIVDGREVGEAWITEGDDDVKRVDTAG